MYPIAALPGNSKFNEQQKHKCADYDRKKKHALFASNHNFTHPVNSWLLLQLSLYRPIRNTTLLSYDIKAFYFAEQF